MSELAVVQQGFGELRNITLLTDGSGQKEVYTAFDGELEVVLKIVKGNANDFLRFEREVACVDKLKVDYVPQIYSYGIRKVGGQDQFFLVEQKVNGQTYREVLNGEAIQPLSAVFNLAHVLLKACCDFEASSIVHRDIKPENIMVDTDGKIWVIDFGIARHLDLPSLTATSTKFGAFTIGYAPPEQFRNIKPDIDVRADLFSVGVMLHESLSGSNPYLLDKHDIFEVIRMMENQDVLPIQISGDPKGEFSDFIACLMSRYPSRRPQSGVQALKWFSPVYEKLSVNIV